MRVKEEQMNIDYNETKAFFKKRANKYQDNNPYSVTMYQDNNPELVISRNQKEVEKLRPMLELGKEAKVLDVACGVGRWADAIDCEIEEYCGVDFSKELIDIAKDRNKKENYSFFVGAANELEKVLGNYASQHYNRVLLMGILMYINDSDVEDFLEQVEHVCEKRAIICVREPIGIQSRLTLKDFYSEELGENYNAIYRTDEELKKNFFEHFVKKGFFMKKEGFLFEEDRELNNRKETAQYYYVLERN